jgi:K+-sensing histidine kinase KdpD
MTRGVARRKWIVGSALCVGAAALMAAMFTNSESRSILPLIFIAVITLVALNFGALAGMLGSVGAALIFAAFLCPPIYSLVVADPRERSSIGWMMLAGFAISYFFAPDAHNDRNPRPQRGKR